jgi:hypothetical protein
MRTMSGGTWAAGSETLTYEERARQTLAFMWSALRYSYSVKSIDGPPWRMVTDVSTMKRRLAVDWSRAPAWLGDLPKPVMVRLRRLWDQKVRGIENPYASPAKEALRA